MSRSNNGVVKRRMHDEQVDTDVGLVRRLVAAAFPQWSTKRIEPVPSSGTDHDIYRLGRDLVVRLPIIDWAEGQEAKEGEWLPRLRPHLPLALPTQVAVGPPALGYPFSWSVYEWLPGRDASHGVRDLASCASDLVAFVQALRAIDPGEAPQREPGDRGCPLSELDGQVRASVARLGDRVDGSAVIRRWDESLEADTWSGREVWIHGDLLPGNLLTVDGRLSAVIDFGGLNVGDPACDLQPAWNLFAGESRRVFRHELGVDDASWRRGRGWVLFQTVAALAYYWDTTPGIVQQASFALGQALDDHSSGG